MKLTKAFTRRTVCQEGKTKQEFYDDDVKGFLLEVRANGRKTFFLRHSTADKKVKYVRIADATILDADSARLKAIKLKRSIEEGKDVILDTPEPEASDVMTMREFYDEHYSPYVIKHIKSHAANISLYKNHILPALGESKLDCIKKLDIITLHSDILHKKKLAPATANKCLIFITHLYNLVFEYEISGVSENPAKGVKPFEENNQLQRFITKHETKRLMLEIHKSENTHLKYIVPMLWRGNMYSYSELKDSEIK